jgi:hypothetical protein
MPIQPLDINHFTLCNHGLYIPVLYRQLDRLHPLVHMLWYPSQIHPHLMTLQKCLWVGIGTSTPKGCKWEYSIHGEHDNSFHVLEIDLMQHIGKQRRHSLLAYRVQSIIVSQVQQWDGLDMGMRSRQVMWR